jgi:hypothetical protein
MRRRRPPRRSRRQSLRRSRRVRTAFCSGARGARKRRECCRIGAVYVQAQGRGFKAVRADQSATPTIRPPLRRLRGARRQPPPAAVCERRLGFQTCQLYTVLHNPRPPLRLLTTHLYAPTLHHMRNNTEQAGAVRADRCQPPRRVSLASLASSSTRAGSPCQPPALRLSPRRT